MTELLVKDGSKIIIYLTMSVTFHLQCGLNSCVIIERTIITSVK